MLLEAEVWSICVFLVQHFYRKKYRKSMTIKITRVVLKNDCGGLLILGTRSKSFIIRPADRMAEFTLGAYERACPNIQAPKISASDTL
jgi:hypothetical protein